MDRSRLPVMLALGVSLASVCVGLVHVISAPAPARSSSFVGMKRAGQFQAREPGIAVLRLSGMIQDGYGVPGEIGADTILEALRELRKNKAARGVLLELNSPGGTAGATKKIYDEVILLRKEKPVVAWISDVAASGGYYIASAANRVVAYEGALLGSIGVISFHMDVSKFLEKHGIQVRALKAGRYKDASFPFRPMTEEETAQHEAVLQDIYGQFLQDVAAGRERSLDEVRTWAEGRIMSGRRALELGMIDGVGGRQPALDLFHKLLETDEEIPVWEPERDFWEEFLMRIPFQGMFGRKALSGGLYLYPNHPLALQYLSDLEILP